MIDENDIFERENNDKVNSGFQKCRNSLYVISQLVTVFKLLTLKYGSSLAPSGLGV